MRQFVVALRRCSADDSFRHITVHFLRLRKGRRANDLSLLRPGAGRGFDALDAPGLRRWMVATSSGIDFLPTVDAIEQFFAAPHTHPRRRVLATSARQIG